MASKIYRKLTKSPSSKNKEALSKPSQNISERGQELDLNFMGSRDELATTRSIASRKRLRDQVDGDVEAFLSKGGKISHIDRNVTADPPKRPISHYGQRPI